MGQRGPGAPVSFWLLEGRTDPALHQACPRQAGPLTFFSSWAPPNAVISWTFRFGGDRASAPLPFAPHSSASFSGLSWPPDPLDRHRLKSLGRGVLGKGGAPASSARMPFFRLREVCPSSLSSPHPHPI